MTGHTPDGHRIFTLIPTFNELENLKSLVPELLKLDVGCEVLIIDDNSPDGTLAWLQDFSRRDPRLHFISRPGKAGYGSALVEGFRYAAEQGAETVVTMDADLSHDPHAVPELVRELADKDLVLGSRYISGCRVLNWSLTRLFISVFANTYVRLLLRMPYADCTTGFRCYRLETLLRCLDLERLKANGYAILVEILYCMHRHVPLRIIEHPIVYSERREGQSKMSQGVILEAALTPWRLWLTVGLPRLRRLPVVLA